MLHKFISARCARSVARRGFTLIEILTVVIILGISAAIIIPSVSNRDDMRAAAAARVVMADLIYAQNRAISTQKPSYVLFDLTAQQYAIYDSAPTVATTIATAIDHPLKPPAYDSKYVTGFGVANTQFAGLTLTNCDFASSKCLKFDELGVPYGYNFTTGITTQLTGLSVGTINVQCGKFDLTVRVEPYTGELTVTQNW